MNWTRELSTTERRTLRGCFAGWALDGLDTQMFSLVIPALLGTLFNELYPQNVRGRGVGFCYNFGRIASAGFPALVGHMGASMPLGTALGIDAGIAYGLVVIAVWFLPETRGRRLPDGGGRAWRRRRRAGPRIAVIFVFRSSRHPSCGPGTSCRQSSWIEQ